MMFMASSNNSNQTDVPYGRDARFFQASISSERIPLAFTDLLDGYSKIPRSRQINHVLTIRNAAYNSHPYPCLGRFRFVDLDLAAHPLYESYVLPKLKAARIQGNAITPITDETRPDEESAATVGQLQGSIFLDLGTCLGQDLRKLIHDGVPPSQVYGADLDTSFVDFGYALFNDEKILPRSHFLTGHGCDVLADPSVNNDSNSRNHTQDAKENDASGLIDLDGKVDILQASMIFHLFSLEDQKKVARRCLKLLRKDTSTKKLLLGGQAGNINACQSHRYNGRKVFRHNEESWREMWESVAAESAWKALGTEVDVWSELIEKHGNDFITSAQEDRKNAEFNGVQNWRNKDIGRVMDGARWQVYTVWVQFSNLT